MLTNASIDFHSKVELPFSVGLSTWMRVLGIICGEGTDSSGEREGESSKPFLTSCTFTCTLRSILFFFTFLQNIEDKTLH